MHLVDLAGIERVDKSKVKGDKLKEAVHINKSLSTLGDVIAALAQKNSHVPYRNSKHTQLLQDSLGGQAKTLMFVHTSLKFDAVGETLSTLKFAERVATIELGAAPSNKENPEVKELKEQIASLKSALARKGGESENFRSTMSSPDIFRMSPGFASPMLREDVGFDAGEVHTDSAANSPRWPDRSPRAKFQKGYEKESSSGEWVDKVMVNKHEALVRDDDSLRDWEGESTTSAPDFYPRYSPDMRAHLEQYHRNASGSVTTDDSDDLDIATSESSEADMPWQVNPSKIPSIFSGGGSNIKKPQPKISKSLETRNPSRSNIPSPQPSRRLSNGPSQTQNRTGRGLDGKRATTGKTGNGK